LIRRLIGCVLAGVLLAGQGAFAGPPPLAPKVDLPATPLGSPNVHLLGTIPDSSSVGGRFVGKYFYTTAGGAVAPTTVGGLRIYDASVPEQPMLTGVVPLPHSENEDLDVSEARKIALISQDNASGNAPFGGRLYVIDIMNPSMPMLRGSVEYPASAGDAPDSSATSIGGKKKLGGPGHIANCILDCLYAYITGARYRGAVYVVSLKDITAPKIIGRIFSPAGVGNDLFKTGTVHDVDVDPYGNIWFTGSGGTAMYAPIAAADDYHALHPRLIAAISPRDNKKYDQFIHHNSLRLNRDTVLVTEEDWEQPQCGDSSNPVNKAVDQGEQGSFQAWHIDGSHLTPLGTWKTELGSYLDGGAAVTITCSSHWFTFNRYNIVAVGWYNQGVRFLDVSNPRRIREVGYWMGPMTMASAGLFVPFRPDIAYVPDYVRGLDIIRIDNAGQHAPTVRAPVRAEWFKGYRGVGFVPPARPDDTFGWACARPTGF